MSKDYRLPKLPKRYKMIEYLESSGTQALNTLAQYTSDVFEIEWRAIDKSSNNTTLFACNSASPYSGGLYGNKNSREYYIGTDNVKLNYSSNDDIAHQWKLTSDGTKVALYKDGSKVGEANANDIAKNLDIFLFCGGYITTSSTTLTQFAKWQLNYWKFTSNNTLIRHFIPVKDTVNNVYGMYDLVTKQFFGNSGTGSFIGGPIIKQVEYIEGNGTQYIVTNFIPNDNNLEVEYKAQKVSSAEGIVYTTTTTSTFCVNEYVSSQIYVRFAGFNENTTISESFYSWHIVKVNKNEALYNGVKVTTVTPTIDLSTNTEKLQLFSRSGNYTYNGKIAYLTISKNSIPVFDLIPVQVGNEYAMYDLVSSTIYRNNGTGAFTGGSEVSPSEWYTFIEDKFYDRLPNEYQEVEYIESNGNQYIDTNAIIDDMNYIIKSDLMYCGTGTPVIYGGMNTTNGYPGIMINGRGDFRYGTSDRHILSSPFVRNTKYSTELSFKKLKLDGIEIIATETTNTSPLAYSIYLFARNNAGVAGDYSNSRIYNWSISHNGELIKDFIPVKRKSDNVLGMYDLANSGKNLFDGISNIVVGKYIVTATGNVGISETNFYCETYFECKPNTSYVFWGERKTDGVLSKYNRIHFYDSNKEYISGSYTVSTKSVVISPSNARYIRISDNVVDSGTLTTDIINQYNWYLGEGSATTNYEPYPFYTNQGTGNFTDGPEVTLHKKVMNVKFIEDKDYEVVEYLESSGTSYIDTGFKPTNNTKASYDFNVVSNYTSDDRHIFGSRTTATSKAFDFAWMNKQSESVRFISNDITRDVSFNTIPQTTWLNRHTWEFTSSYWSLDGETKITYTTLAYTGDYNLWLFAVNNAGTAHSQYINQKVYNCKIWENDVLVRNFIPVKRLSDNKYGMYDTVTKQFFGNSGTGNFTGGPTTGEKIIKSISMFIEMKEI